jgi:hypothetical protein
MNLQKQQTDGRYMSSRIELNPLSKESFQSNEDEIRGIHSTKGEINVFQILFGKPEGNRLLQRPCQKWEYNVKMYLKGIG